MPRALTTSLDGQWAVYRNDRELVTFAGGAAPAVGTLALDAAGSADAEIEIALLGPPVALAVLTRHATTCQIALHQPPYLDQVATLDLAQPMRLAAVTGPRVALVSGDGKRVEIIRAAPRALTTHPLDVGGAVEFVVGLERNQLLFGLPRKLEVWDAVSGRPLLRLQMQLPPPPRTVGAAAGHLWVTRPGSDEVYIYRLSDGRPFRHYVGAPVDDVISHPASPLIVLVTARGLVRLHCFAHSVAMLDVPTKINLADAALAQLVAGEDVSLIGLNDGSTTPWHMPISGSGAPTAAPEPVDTGDAPLATAADKLRAMRERSEGANAGSESGPVPRASSEISLRSGGASSASSASSRLRAPTAGGASNARWRDPLVTYAQEVARGVDGDLPVVAIDTELGALAQRLGLPSSARRALIALYALYLIGEPELAIARLARGLGGDWTEALGNGELGALAMLRRVGGKVSLRATIADALDGHPPRAIRVLGDAAVAPPSAAVQVARAGRDDAAIEAALVHQLGRIAVVEGALSAALLEARIHGAVAVALSAPARRPTDWPRETSLVVVTDGAVPAWVAALPTL
jgi:hypothetical protein